MSSALLYLAIVAIWAMYLVPAWIRRPQVDRADAELDDPVEGEAQADAELGAAEANPEIVTGAPPAAAAAVDSHAEKDDHHSFRTHDGISEYRGNVRDYADSGAMAEAEAAATHPAPAGHPGSRQQMLRARRRMLVILLVLTTGAAAGVALGLTKWWMAIPPAVMLAAYLLLLREIAMAEAEQAARRHQEQAEYAARLQAQRDWAGGYVEPTAQIIDISGRLGDQLYDQYADAAVRAVGD